MSPSPNLVLLPGMLGDASLWDEVCSRLTDVVTPVVARIDRDDSIPAMARRVLAGAPGSFVLVGHSLGAIVAQEVLRQAPGRVRGLVLLNASGRGPVPAQVQAWSAWRIRTRDGEFAAVAGELAIATLAPDRRDDAELVARNAAMADTVGPDGFCRQLAAQATRPDSLGTNPAARAPVLVISGARDGICPPALQQELAASFRQAVLCTVDGGHMLPLERPTEVAQALRAWMRKLA